MKKTLLLLISIVTISLAFAPAERLNLLNSDRFENCETLENYVFRIENRWMENKFINAENGYPECGNVGDGWVSARWVFEETDDGFVRMRNQWSNKYLHSENGRLEVGDIQQGWYSAQWKFEDAQDDRYWTIKNRWTNTYLNMENGSLQCGDIQPGWHSAQWDLDGPYGE